MILCLLLKITPCPVSGIASCVFLLISVVAGLLWNAGRCRDPGMLPLALLLLLFHHQRQLAILDNGFKLKNPVPDASGKWGDVFARLIRLMREQRQTQQQISSALGAAAARYLGHARRRGNNGRDGRLIMAQFRCRKASWDQRAPRCGPAYYPSGAPYAVRRLSGVSDYSEPLVMKQSRQQGMILSLQIVPYGDKQNCCSAGTSPVWKKSSPCGMILSPMFRMSFAPP